MSLTTSDKYWNILEHPALNFKYKGPEIEIEPHTICKSSGKIESYQELNTTMQLWIEVRIPQQSDDNESDYIMVHDYELDCGGFTYEEAIDNLYNLVMERYGIPEKNQKPVVKNSRVRKRAIAPEFNDGYNINRISVMDTFDPFTRENIESLTYDIQGTEKTIKAIEEFISIIECDKSKKDLLKQYRTYLKDEEYNLWVKKKSKELKLDIDL